MAAQPAYTYICSGNSVHHDRNKKINQIHGLSHLLGYWSMECGDLGSSASADAHLNVKNVFGLKAISKMNQAS